jgi:3'(2'), 5'-bisphosphate nucleotidase
MSDEAVIDEADLRRLVAAARQAGQAIMKVYAQDFEVEYKADESPLTEADRASQAVLAGALAEHFPDVPVLSEEGAEIPWEDRRGWERFWCVDPLDGTKEFVKRNGEFCICIGFVVGVTPVFGLVHAPVLDATYYGGQGLGAFKAEGQGDFAPIQVAGKGESAPLRAVGSRSHPSADLQKFLEQWNVVEQVPAGSALKFCRVAEGTVDLYARLNPTMEWDTAAGQAIVQAAGGTMTDLDGNPFLYNKKSLRNGGFVVKGWS